MMAVSAKSKKQKVSKKNSKQGLLSRFKLGTRKSKLIASVLAFAVIGGGFMVYRSFAAVPYSTAVDCKTFEHSAPEDCKVVQTAGSKNALPLYLVLKHEPFYSKAGLENGTRPFYSKPVVRMVTKIEVQANTGFKICAMMRPVQNSSVVFQYEDAYRYRGTALTSRQSIGNNSNVIKVCSEELKTPYTQLVDASMWMQTGMSHVEGMSVELIQTTTKSPQPAPAPAPAPPPQPTK